MRSVRTCTGLVIVTALSGLVGCDGAARTGDAVGDAAPPPLPCAPSTVPSGLASPDPRAPWSGAVTLVPTTLLDGIPLAGATIDGAPLPTPTPQHPWTVLDTRTLSDGAHQLVLDTVDAQAVHARVETRVCVVNAAPASPFEGRFVDVTAASGLSALAQVPSGLGANTVLAAGLVADFDGDGALDVFGWNGDGGQLFRQDAPLRFSASGPRIADVRAAAAGDLDGDGDVDLVVAGPTIGLLRNDGGAMVDVTADAGFTPPSTDAALRAVTLADVDYDGLLDLAFAPLDCTTPRPAILLRNEGALRFADVTAEVGLDAPGGGYGVAIDDPLEAGAPQLVRFHEGCLAGESQRIVLAPAADLPSVASTTRLRPLPNAPMGSAFLDADGDGVLDLLVATDLANPLLRGPAFADNLAPTAGLDTYAGTHGDPVSTWALLAFDADLDGRTDVLAVHQPSDEIGFGTVDDPGYALFVRGDGGRYVDRAASAGLVGQARCRALHAGDLDGDGDADVVVGCDDGVRVLRNDLRPAGAARAIELRAGPSASGGVHARIEVDGAETRLIRAGGQPYAGGVIQESVPTGAGFTVRWPSGAAQHVGPASGPRVTSTEPPLFSVTPRRVVAGAGATVAIEVDPRASGGADATVKASAGTFVAPLTRDADGVYRATLSPPMSRSTVVLTISIDGRASLVRPRVFVR